MVVSSHRECIRVVHANLDDTNSEFIIISGMSQQHYIFTPTGGGNTSCDLPITALNDAGASDPSEIITRSFPSLPDIYQVEDSLQHSLRMVSS